MEVRPRKIRRKVGNTARLISEKVTLMLFILTKTITSSTHIFCPLIEAWFKPGNANWPISNQCCVSYKNQSFVLLRISSINVTLGWNELKSISHSNRISSDYQKMILILFYKKWTRLYYSKNTSNCPLQWHSFFQQILNKLEKTPKKCSFGSHLLNK